MPSKDCRRPIERRFQPGMNASRKFGLTIENRARIAMRSIEQRMLAPESKRALHIEGKARGPRQITVVGTSGTARDTFQHQLLGSPPGHQHGQHVFVPVTGIGGPDVEADEIVAALAGIDTEAANGSEIESMMHDCMPCLVEGEAPAQIVRRGRAMPADALFDILTIPRSASAS